MKPFKYGAAAFPYQMPMFSLWSSSWSIFFLVSALLLFFVKNPPSSIQNYVQRTPESLFEITVKDINGADVRLSTFSGKVLLFVNVASKCALTHKNYMEMNILYEKYRDKGFVILAFPCNQFLSQEPGSNEEIQEIACTKFKAEFPIFDKIDVNGRNAAPLYKFLKSRKGGFFGNGIKWNFTKFLVDKQGKVVRRYGPTTSPLNIEEDIQKLLLVS